MQKNETATNEQNPAKLRKTCRTCGAELPLSAFYRQRGCHAAYRLDCKECTGLRAWHARTVKRQLPPQTLCCGSCGETKPVNEFARDRRRHSGRRRLCRPCHALALRESATPQGLNVPDEQIIPGTPLHQRRIDLGLAVAAATFPPGHCCTYEEIAAFTGLTPATVQNIERRALAKLNAAARQLLGKGLLHLVPEEQR